MTPGSFSEEGKLGWWVAVMVCKGAALGYSGLCAPSRPAEVAQWIERQLLRNPLGLT